MYNTKSTLTQSTMSKVTFKTATTNHHDEQARDGKNTNIFNAIDRMHAKDNTPNLNNWAWIVEVKKHIKITFNLREEVKKKKKIKIPAICGQFA